MNGAGFGGLLRRWVPDTEEFLAHLQQPVIPPVRLDRFSCGIDNAHIDVTLSPLFVARVRALVSGRLSYEISKSQGLHAIQPPDRRDTKAFLKAYREMCELALDRARKTSRPEYIQLLQFAAWKFLLLEIRKQIDDIRGELIERLGLDPKHSSGQAMQLHHRRVVLARGRDTMLNNLTHQLFRELRKLETSEMHKLRQSIIGMAWPLPREVLFNPLLLLPGVESDEQLMEAYPLLLTEREGTDGFALCNQMITTQFAAYLPDWAKTPEGGGREGAGAAAGNGSGEAPGLGVTDRVDQGGLPGYLEVERRLAGCLREEEFREPKYCWLDVPENLDRLFFQTGASSRVGPAESERHASAPAHADTPEEKRWAGFQQRQVLALLQSCRRAGLWRPILAAYETQRVHKALLGKVPPRDILRYLGGTITAARLQQRLRGLQLGEEVPTLIKMLKIEFKRIDRLPKLEQQGRVQRYLRDFVRMRRDLKYALVAHRAMDRIRLVSGDEEIQLSRANRSLQEFGAAAESAPKRERIRNHVVIKADLRGSTEITASLVEKNLNPASYFSLNFFGPINALIEEFGARKVFVEGDAIILTFYEREDVSYRWLSVAHACGLARKILGVIEAQNAQNRRHQLPELEVGIGIAFSDGAPMFLYDDEHQIMISPAINRADRLSSCAPQLRNSRLHELRGGNGVELVAALEGGADGGEKLLRYNVGGVELEAPAFFKLKLELALKQMQLSSGDGQEPQHLHVGRYPDRNGNMHLLAIREAPIRIWIGNDFSTVEQRGRRFFEVVTDRAILAQLRERFNEMARQ